jgi:hypothetical protein
VLLLGCAHPAVAWSWGGATHHYIAQHYSQHLPPSVDGLRAYDSVVDAHVTDPDTRKPTTPGESYRHYIDIDVYPEFLAGTLPHDRAALEALYGAPAVLENGIVPWAIGEVVNTLTAQFQAGQWSAAALTIADLCHYVGDSTQPLHCTQNYNGQLSGNTGIHSRYETTMMASHLGELTTPPMGVEDLPHVVDAMFDSITVSWAGAGAILQADNAAKAASGGSYNATYYASLWTNTQALTRARINAATRLTASLVFTAWVNAGEPVVPGSSAGVGPAVRPVAKLEAGPSPFRDRVDIRYAGAGTGPLDVDVFDVRGARVAHLVGGATAAGSVTWRPADSGRRAGPGLYFVRLSGPDLNLVRRVTLLE